MKVFLWFLLIVFGFSLELVDLDIKIHNPVTLTVHILSSVLPPTKTQGYGYALDASIQIATALNYEYSRVSVISVLTCDGSDGSFSSQCTSVHNKTDVVYDYTVGRRQLRREMQTQQWLIVMKILFPTHPTSPPPSKVAMDFQLKLRNPLSSLWQTVEALEFGNVIAIQGTTHELTEKEENIESSNETFIDSLADISLLTMLLIVFIILFCSICCCIIVGMRCFGSKYYYDGDYFNGSASGIWATKSDAYSVYDDYNDYDYATTYGDPSEATSYFDAYSIDTTLSDDALAILAKKWEQGETVMDDADLEITKRKKKKMKRENTKNSFGPILVKEEPEFIKEDNKNKKQNKRSSSVPRNHQSVNQSQNNNNNNFNYPSSFSHMPPNHHSNSSPHQTPSIFRANSERLGNYPPPSHVYRRRYNPINRPDLRRRWHSFHQAPQHRSFHPSSYLPRHASFHHHHPPYPPLRRTQSQHSLRGRNRRPPSTTNRTLPPPGETSHFFHSSNNTNHPALPHQQHQQQWQEHLQRPQRLSASQMEERAYFAHHSQHSPVHTFEDKKTLAPEINEQRQSGGKKFSSSLPQIKEEEETSAENEEKEETNI